MGGIDLPSRGEEPFMIRQKKRGGSKKKTTQKKGDKIFEGEI